METARLTTVAKDRIGELSGVAKDRTAAERQRRYRQRHRKNLTVTAAVTGTIATALQPKRYGFVPFVLLCAALAVAAVSGSFSVIGLTAVFTGAFWPILCMGVALEAAKLSAVAWLGRRYAASRIVKGAIVTLVGALMVLNVIGSYGFLAKAHLDHAVAGEAQVTDHNARIDARKELAVATVADIDRRIAQIDSAIDEATRRGHTTSAMALLAREADRRKALVADRARAASALASIEVEKAGIENERNGLTADSGPVRYLSKLIGLDQDAATSWFILFVALLLDPLALVLLLTASARPQSPVVV
jgi:hypothetical protein